MTLRIRTLQKTQTGTRNGAPRVRVIRDERMEDIGDMPQDAAHICDHKKASISRSLSNGIHSFNVLDVDYPSSLAVTDYTLSGMYFASTNASVYSRMCAATAPGRTSVQVPVLIAELKDIPRIQKFGLKIASILKQEYVMLKNGRWRDSHKSRQVKAYKLAERIAASPGQQLSRAKLIAEANLVAQFGIVPVISDILKMCGAVEDIDRRRREIAKFRKDGRVTRRWGSVETITKPVVVTNRIIEARGNHTVPVTIVETGKQWAVITWSKGYNTALPKDDAEMLRMMYGFTPATFLTGAWELLPWSWFFDYFTNVGDILQAFANGIQYDVYGSVMTEHKIIARHPSHTTGAGNSIHTLSSGELVKSHFHRDVFGGTPHFAVFEDILSPKQLSILGSLAMARG